MDKPQYLDTTGPAAPGYTPYQGEIPLQPVQAVQVAGPPVAEVQHHNEANRDDDSDTESDGGYNQKSPGDVPQKYLNLEFEATFHEHKKTALVKPVHEIFGVVYKWMKLIVYHFFVFLIGIPLMLVWALLNGITAFVYSWIWSPVLRLTIFWVAATLPLVTMPLVSIARPLVDVAARCFRQIRLKAKFSGEGFVQNV